MNETLLWLLYCMSGGMAFAAVFIWRWRIGWAVISGGLVTAIGWILMFAFADGDKRPDWVQLDMSLNIVFGLIFALFGALAGRWSLGRSTNAD